MKFVEITFPLLVAISEKAYTPREFDEMVLGYERYFQRGERYALITWTPDGGELPGALARKRIADWANEPRVREMSARLCVGSSAVVPSAASRAAMTALLWFWKPASPLKLCATPTQAIDWCLDRLLAEGLSVRHPRAEVHEMLRREVFV